MSALSTIISGIPFRVSKLFGGNHVDGGSCTTTDSTGNILIGGNTSSYPFDETYGNGGTSAFVTKRTSKGDRLWTRLLGKGNTWAFAIATGQGDDVYIAGYTADDLDGTHTGWSDFFIAKYDSDGQLEWVRQLGVAGTNTQAKGLAVDGNGNAYIIGVTGGDLSGIPRTGNWDMFVAKYDLTGERQWLKLYGDSGSLVEGKAIVATSSGFVVTGTTSGWFYGEKGSLTPVFVMVCDISGNRIWSHTIGANITTKVAGIGLNADGDIYITGYTDGSLMGNPKIGLQDIFLTKFSAGGDHIWTKTSGSSGRYKNATGIMIDASGIYIVGTVTDSQAYFNLFLEKYTADGERIWSVIRGTEKPNSVTGITAFADRIYVVGSTTSFEENPALGYSDVFLAGFNSEYGCY